MLEKNLQLKKERKKTEMRYKLFLFQEKSAL